MLREAAESAAVVRAQLAANREPLRRLGAALRDEAPRAVVTIARGSSDHAATYARYLLETRFGVLTSSAAPSVSSVYSARTNLGGALCLAISQSGRSPDLLAAAEAARAAGAKVVALVNAEDAPLAVRADYVVWLRAGRETSVAATKSHIASLAAILQLVSEWQRDQELAHALEALPEDLERAWALDWSPAMEHIQGCAQPVRARPRPRPRSRAGGRAEAQGNGGPARRRPLGGGTAARAHGART